MNVRNLLIRALIRLLDPGYSNVEENDKEIQDWLTFSGGHMGFIKYCQSRERNFLKALGKNMMAPPPRDAAYRLIGQRLETLLLVNKAAKAKKASERRRAEKEERFNTNK